MSVVLALGAAVAWGVTDHLRAVLSRRTAILPFVVAAQAVAAVLIAAGATALPGEPRVVDLAWGATAGAGGVVGITAMTLGFRRARVGIVAAVGAVSGAGIPVVVGVALGERPGSVAQVGILVGLVAIWLLSRGHGSGRAVERRTAQAARRAVRRRPGQGSGLAAAAAPGGHQPIAPGGAPATPHGSDRRVADGPVTDLRRSGLALGLLSGVGFGAAYLALGQAAPASGLWPAMAAQASVTLLALLALLVRGQRLRLPAGDRPRVLGIGTATAIALVCFLLATYTGPVTIAAVIASMSPAVTLLLAAVLLGERLSSGQQAGFVLALVALAALSAG